MVSHSNGVVAAATNVAAASAVAPPITGHTRWCQTPTEIRHKPAATRNTSGLTRPPDMAPANSAITATIADKVYGPNRTLVGAAAGGRVRRRAMRRV